MKTIRLQHHATRFLFTVAIAITLGESARAALVTGSQNVNGNRATPQYTDGGNTYGPYGWNYSYTRQFDGTSLIKHLEIDFVFDAGLGYNNAQKAAYRAQAVANIEGVWDNKFSVKDTTTGTLYPIKVDVTTVGPFNQTVTVKQAPVGTDPPYNMTSWYVSQDTAASQAHEFGHMLGLFDEYIGGAVNQYPNPTLSNDGLMGLGALNANPVMYPRYYQQFLDYISGLNPTESFSLVAVPEPSTYLIGLLAAGVLLYEIAKRRWSATRAVSDSKPQMRPA